MKRWNGWGTEGTPYPLPASAGRYLQGIVGKGEAARDARLEDVLEQVPASRLPAHPLVSTEAADRLRHARGQSMPDWVALRSGRIGVYPDGVAYPGSPEEVRALLAYARQTGARLIPYGGGSSVVGHINPLPGDQPVLTVDLGRMNQMESLDEVSGIAVFGAGVRGPDLENTLNARGFTLGHFPQSFEYSTLGGWVASRSVGTQCYYYGRIEQLFLGGQVETPAGGLELPVVPASAAGPDLKQLVLGSEGRMGIITRAAVRVRRLPRREKFYAVFFPDWEHGFNALRQIVQARIPVSMLRLLNAEETETTLQLSGKEKFVQVAHSGLSLIGIGAQRTMMLFGVTGEPGITRAAYRAVSAIAHAQRGFSMDYVIGHSWYKARFVTPYLRNTLWDYGYALDTLETALPWCKATAAVEDMQKTLQHALDDCGERVLVFTHLSHMYTDGASLYVTYLFRQGSSPEETLRRWHLMKDAASRRIVAHGGTISHQHGVGLDHAPYLAAEKGELGMQALRSAFQFFDPNGMMNPGKLIEVPHVE